MRSSASWLRDFTRKQLAQVNSSDWRGRTRTVSSSWDRSAPGSSNDSAASASATTNIDVVPGQVPQPTGSPGNGEATFTWSAPANEGSAITGYTVYLSGPGGSQQQTVTGTSATFRGLSNGGAYTATVVATNAKGSSQSQSAPSAPVVPYGAPGAVTITDVSQANRGASGSSDSVRVSWTPGDDNGRAVEYYTVTVGGASKRVSAAEGTSIIIPARSSTSKRSERWRTVEANHWASAIVEIMGAMIDTEVSRCWMAARAIASSWL